MVEKLESIVHHVQRTFFIAVVTFMLLVLSLHVIMRFMFDNPITWADRVITMIQGTLAFVGIDYCFHKKQRTELSLVYDKVPCPVQWPFDLAPNGIMLFCTCYMIKYSWKFTLKKNIQMNTIPWTGQSWIYYSIAVGFILAICYILLRLIEVFHCINKELKERG